MPAFMPISLRIGPLTTEIVAIDVVLLERAVMPLDGERQDHRQIFRPRTRHHRIDRHLLDRELPEFAERGRPQPSDHLVRRMARALEHLRDALFGRQDDRQAVGPVILDEQALEIVLGIGLEQPRR